MKYLSIDLEATGLEENSLMLEFSAIPFSVKERKIEESMGFHVFVKCPSFEDLRPSLNDWVIENNQAIIEKCHREGQVPKDICHDFANYLERSDIKNYFENKNIILFGKSLSALDLPLMNRFFGYEFMRKYFSHKTLDLTCLAYALIDLSILPDESEGSQKMMSFFNMGNVSHTAKEDAINTAKMYFKTLDLVHAHKSSFV